MLSCDYERAILLVWVPVFLTRWTLDPVCSHALNTKQVVLNELIKHCDSLCCSLFWLFDTGAHKATWGGQVRIWTAGAMMKRAKDHMSWDVLGTRTNQSECALGMLLFFFGLFLGHSNSHGSDNRPFCLYIVLYHSIHLYVTVHGTILSWSI